MASTRKIEIDEPASGKSRICEPILRALPGWFGVECSIVQYVKDVETMPTLIARAQDEAVGFLTIKSHNEFSAEVHVMAVRLEMRREQATRGKSRISPGENARPVHAGRRLCENESFLHRDGISPAGGVRGYLG